MRPTAFLFILFLVACSSESIRETEPKLVEQEKEEEIELDEIENCPIVHEKSTEREPLQRRWKLVGFIEDGDDGLIYPPCVGYKEYQPGYNYPYMMHLELMEIPYEAGSFECVECLWFSGFAGVNRIFGFYRFDEDSGFFSLGAGQTLAGGHPELLAFEFSYLENLNGVTAYSLEGNELYLYHEDGKMLYTPTDVIPAELQESTN